MRIGIIGCGNIGRDVARELDMGAVPGACLAALSSRNLEKAREFALTLSNPPPVVPLEELVTLVDLVLEAAGNEAMDSIAEATLRGGKNLMVMSGGALLGRDDLQALAQERGLAIYVPSGAIIGLDGLLSASSGHIDSVTMVSSKPPEGLRGAPGVTDIDLDAITEPTVVFEGPVSEGCRLFPANVNVSAAVSMAGIGAHKTKIQVVADPTITRNTHRVVAEGAFGRLEVCIENVPSESNPRTSALATLSVMASLRKLVSPLKVGT